MCMAVVLDVGNWGAGGLGCARPASQTCTVSQRLSWAAPLSWPNVGTDTLVEIHVGNSVHSSLWLIESGGSQRMGDLQAHCLEHSNVSGATWSADSENLLEGNFQVSIHTTACQMHGLRVSAGAHLAMGP